MKELFNSFKWVIGIIVPLLAGSITWAFQVEKRVAVIETSQTEASRSLNQIGDDIRYIRNLIIEEIKKDN